MTREKLCTKFLEGIPSKLIEELLEREYPLQLLLQHQIGKEESENAVVWMGDIFLPDIIQLAGGPDAFNFRLYEPEYGDEE